MERKHLPAEMAEIPAPVLPPAPPQADPTQPVVIPASAAPSTNSGTVEELRALLEAQGDLVREMETAELATPAVVVTSSAMSGAPATPAASVEDVQPIDQDQEPETPHPVLADAPPPEMANAQNRPGPKRRNVFLRAFLGR